MLFFTRNMFPENLVQACFQQVQTVYGKKKVPIVPPTPENPVWGNDSALTNFTVTAVTELVLTTMSSNLSNVTSPVSVPEMVTITTRGLKYTDGVNVLGELHDWLVHCEAGCGAR